MLRRAVPTLLLAVLLGGGALAGCSDAAPAAAAPAGTRAPDTRAPDTRAADVSYARGMIPHHQQALELAALARGRAASPDVADLAFRIDRDQVEEVGQLQGLLRSWGLDPSGAMVPGMAGMASTATLDRLRATSGPAFDRLWLETMTAHHRGALDMARAHLAATGDASPLREFSRTLLVSQQAEIDRMTTLLAA